ncbi:MAG TPA: bifunctional helix-turn-helix transcriptional regulator/GNAT family N-acetyltransferase [Steroidobacteraceae bacterium]|nr:bifunctional helix-turn-helix transcriptional regulator/GNAT family N-acetyltransferase [Steroidobacteraceae bacterium]
MPAAGTQKKQAAKRTAIDPPLIDAVRQFNRFYTRQLGLLEKGYLSSRWTLTEARVLYEIARKPNLTAAEIAADLHLDVAYLSRMLATFERQRLLRRTVSKTDARQRHLALTAKGIAAFQPLNQAAADQVTHMLAPLAASQRTTLLSAMHRVEELLDGRPQLSSPFTLRALQVGDIGWITHRQGLLYAQEYGWDVSYEALVAEILAAFIKDFHPDRSAAWIAETSGLVPGVVGSVFLVPAAASVAKLRLLYVEPSMRGMGLGRRLVDECIAGARARGYRTLTLWTNSVLISARRIYEAVGFQLRAEERHHSFGKDLVGQTWERTL